MPHGARKDTAVTKLLFKNGLFLDRRSFVSLNANEPHLYLKGDDMSAQRIRVLRRDKTVCQKCRKQLTSGDGEAHHKIHRGKGGFDDLANLEWICRECHRGEHVQVQWTKKEKQ